MTTEKTCPKRARYVNAVFETYKDRPYTTMDPVDRHRRRAKLRVRRKAYTGCRCADCVAETVMMSLEGKNSDEREYHAWAEGYEAAELYKGSE